MKNKKLTRLVTLIAIACLFCCGAMAGTFKTISIDGSFGDWAGVSLADTDPLDNPSGVDYGDVYVANDNNYLYIRFTLYAAADPFTFQQNIFIDADNTPGTGYGANGLGSEMLIQSGAGYQEKNGTFNEGGITGLGGGTGSTRDSIRGAHLARSHLHIGQHASLFQRHDRTGA